MALIIVGIHMFFQMSYSIDTKQLDDIMSECLSDDDHFVIAYVASQNIMTVCDFDMRFIFVVTDWPGSTHDTRILNDTLLIYA
jgi:hypothetical protein